MFADLEKPLVELKVVVVRSEVVAVRNEVVHNSSHERHTNRRPTFLNEVHTHASSRIVWL